MPKIQSALVAYSILKDQLEKADLYEGLMFFFRPITASVANKIFIPAEFSNLLAESYGLKVPPSVIESLAERMSNSGLIYKFAGDDSAASYRYSESDLTPTSVSLPLINELLDDFKSYAKKQSQEISSLEDAYLEQAFFDRLINIESLEIFSRKDATYSQKKTPNTITKPKSTERNYSTVDTHLDYVVSRYILELRYSDDMKFQFLSDVASANLAAETILTYRDPPKKGEAFDELEIYLDAPLVLDILGVNIGKEEFGVELASELKRGNCKVNIFLHSINEIERILENRRQSYLNRTNYIGKSQVDPPNIQALVNSLTGHSEQILTEQYGFFIIDSAESIPSNRRLSVGAEHEKIIREQLSGWSSEEGREVDVNTCCDLIRLRSSIGLQTRILKSGVILVSRNIVLASAANKAWKAWLSERNAGSSDRIRKAAPLVIMDKHLIGLIWITQGGNIGRLARAHLVANCAAAIATKKDIITKVYNLLVDISPQAASTFEAVINDQRAERALMNYTFGDPEVITNDNVIPVLEKLKLEVANEITQAKNDEIQILKIQLEEQAALFGSDKAQLALDRDNALSEKKVLKRLLDDIESDKLTERKLLLNKSFRKACFSYQATTVLTVLIISSLIYVLSDFISIPEQPRLLKEGVKLFLTLLSGGFLFSWDIPGILFGGLRQAISEFIFKYYASANGVGHLLDDYTYSFKDKKLDSNK
ncbi:MAG: hypothetical protein Q7U77_01635 [Sediminibacterium sp.]|uniref:hypothetical protein n=1 Tax=Sediminibacterium sp. TaxID=1917865 RepID=UPI00271E656E|nr:hypothetical protein [Sediminibacterium sp.]MDO8995305.1 hypothetical protein [Sediminibacterium sp.]